MAWQTTTTEYELLTEAIEQLERTRAFPLVFGGLAASDGVRISAFAGHRTARLAGMHIRHHRGLGGRSLVEQRPRLTDDYGGSRAITHDYDPQILGEQVRALVAVPIVVDSTVRGLLYAGERGGSGLGGVAVEPVLAVARRLELGLAERDRVERRRLAATAEATGMPGAGPIAPAQLAELRASREELRAIRTDAADAAADPALVERLRRLERRLAGVAADDPALDDEPVRLAPRELEALLLVEQGLRNAEIGARLGLAESTVKAYLGSAMRRLSARSRHEAAAEARRRRLLP